MVTPGKDEFPADHLLAATAPAYNNDKERLLRTSSNNNNNNNSNVTFPHTSQHPHDYKRDVAADHSRVADLNVIDRLLAMRLVARKTGRFEDADDIRDTLLLKHGVRVSDKDKMWRSGCSASGSGQRWGSGRSSSSRDRPGTSSSQERLYSGSSRAEAMFKNHGHNYKLEFGAGPNVSKLDDHVIHQILTERHQHRINREFAEADRITEYLNAAGVSVNDRTREWRADGRGRLDRGFGPMSGTHGHDYEVAPDAGPNKSKLDEREIHALLAARLKCKLFRDFAGADEIQTELHAAGVYIHDKQRIWRADGVGFREVSPFSFSGPTLPYEQSSESLMVEDEDVAQYIAKALVQRTKAAMDGNHQLANGIRDKLKEDYNVHIDDRLRQWSIGGKERIFRRAYRMSFSTEPPEDECEIQRLVEQREEARSDKDFTKADQILDDLVARNVSVDDHLREWSVKKIAKKPGPVSEPVSVDFRRRGGGAMLTAEKEQVITNLLRERDGYRQDKEYDKADGIYRRLESDFQVRCHDRTKEWWVITDELYSMSKSSVPLGLATKQYIEDQVAKRAVAKYLDRDYETADGIRDMLLRDYRVSIDDKNKEWSAA
jgi:cysteinyl-tRNA synthetase